MEANPPTSLDKFSTRTKVSIFLFNEFKAKFIDISLQTPSRACRLHFENDVAIQSRVTQDSRSFHGCVVSFSGRFSLAGRSSFLRLRSFSRTTPSSTYSVTQRRGLRCATPAPLSRVVIFELNSTFSLWGIEVPLDTLVDRWVRLWFMRCCGYCATFQNNRTSYRQLCVVHVRVHVIFQQYTHM